MPVQVTVENLLRWNTDNASVAAAIKANQEVSNSATASSSAIASQATASAASAGAQGLLARAWDENTIAARGFLGELERIQAAESGLTAQTLTLTAAQRAQAAFVTRAGQGGAQQSLFNARQAAIALPGVGFQSPIVLGLRGAETAVGAGVGLPVLGAAAVAAAPLIIGAAKAIEALGKDSEAAAERANTFADAYTRALEAGTTAQVQELIKRQKLEIAIAQATQEALRAKAADAQSQLGNFLDRTSADLAARLQQGAQDIGLSQTGGDFSTVPAAESQEAYNAQIEEQQKLIDQGNIALEAYNLVFGENILLTGDAADLQEKLLDNQKLILERDTERDLNGLKNQVDAQKMTAEERAKEVDQLQEFITVAELYRDTNTLTEDAQRSLAIQLDDARDRTAALTETTLSYADVLDQLAKQEQLLSDQTDNYLDALEREGEVRDQIAQITQDIADTLLEKQQKLADVAADASDRIDQVEADAGERREQIAQDSAEKIYKIERDFGRSRLNAIRDRDVDALIQARERRDDELEDQKKADEKALKQVDTALEKQEKSIKKSLDRQVQQIEQSYDRELAAKRRRLDQANVDLQNLLYAEQQIAMYGANNQRIIHTQMWQDVNAIAVTWAANTVNTLRSIFSQVMGTTGGSASPASMQYIDDRIRQRFADIFA